jgi:thiosulfate reductase cytochrome b subunit
MDRGDAPLNVAYATGYVPLLLERQDPAGERKLGPFNAVGTWFWASGASDRAVPPGIVRAAYLDEGRYAPAILAVFDADHDGAIRSAELRLDTGAKTELIRSRLRALGVADPVIRQKVSLHPLEHGVLAGAQVQRDCGNCHARDSRLSGGLPLAAYTPAGAESSGAVAIEGAGPADGVRLQVAGPGSRIEARSFGNSGRYVFGNSRRAWTNRLGFGLFVIVLLGVLFHGALRVVARRRPAGRAASGPKVYLYTVYERVWHWLMAMSIIALMLSGLQVEFAGVRSILPLPTTVAIHNFFAVVLTVNAFLSLFYHLTAGAIRQFIPPRDGLARQVAEQARYYAQGIFLGQPHPSPRTPDRKLNPLQQLTYLALLNVLFPFQVITGVLIWGVSRWPRLAGATDGLTVVAPLHSLGAWLFLAFFVLHLYLTTTGHTVFSHIRAMIDGYGESEPEARTELGGSHA